MLGASAAGVMAVLIMISTFGCANGLVLTGPRLYQTMAADGLLFAGLARLSARGVPARALVLQGAWASLLALSGRYGELLDYVIATALVFYALTVIGLLRLRARHGVTDRSRLVPVAYVVGRGGGVRRPAAGQAAVHLAGLRDRRARRAGVLPVAPGASAHGVSALY